LILVLSISTFNSILVLKNLFSIIQNDKNSKIINLNNFDDSLNVLKIFIGEKMTLQMILGGIIILIGIGITYLPETKRK
jgi:uncharacterized membrane protein